MKLKRCTTDWSVGKEWELVWIWVRWGLERNIASTGSPDLTASRWSIPRVTNVRPLPLLGNPPPRPGSASAAAATLRSLQLGYPTRFAPTLYGYISRIFLSQFSCPPPSWADKGKHVHLWPSPIPPIIGSVITTEYISQTSVWSKYSITTNLYAQL